MLLMLGVWLFTVNPTVMFWDFEVTLAPDATTVILAA